MLDQRDIAAVDDEDHAHCIAGQILGALKETALIVDDYRGRSIIAAFERL